MLMLVKIDAAKRELSAMQGLAHRTALHVQLSVDKGENRISRDDNFQEFKTSSPNNSR